MARMIDATAANLAQAQFPSRLAICLRPVAQLVGNSRNPRIHTDRQVQQIAASIAARLQRANPGGQPRRRDCRTRPTRSLPLIGLDGSPNDHTRSSERTSNPGLHDRR